MSVSTQTARAKLVPPTTQTIYNTVSPGAPNTEFSQVLSDGTKKVEIKARTTTIIKWTFVSGESGTKYRTIRRGRSYTIDGINLANKTLYMQVDKANITIEIAQWT